MKDLKQIKTIHKALEMEKEKRMTELLRTNSYIKKKMDMIKKMLAYQNEYFDPNQLHLTKSTPTLFKNLNAFSKKIDDIIQAEEKEVEKLNSHKNIKLKELEKLNQKIELMQNFAERIIQEKNLKMDVTEQLAIDDLSNVKTYRGNHE